MKQRWEIVHWPNGKRVQLCDSKEVADRLLPYHGKSHIVKEVWFHDDGTLYDEKQYGKLSYKEWKKKIP
jgi:hypothetical protein